MVSLSDARPDTCFGKIKLGMFVGYGCGWQDGARNRLGAASKGRVHAWLNITRVAWGGKPLLAKSPWPCPVFFRLDHPWPCPISKAHCSAGIWGSPFNVCCTIAFCWGIQVIFWFNCRIIHFWALQIHCCKYVANSKRLHCKWCQSQTDFMGGILGLASHCPGLPKTFKNPAIVQGYRKPLKMPLYKMLRIEFNASLVQGIALKKCWNCQTIDATSWGSAKLLLWW